VKGIGPDARALAITRYYRAIPAPVRLLSAGMLINRAGAFVYMFLALILSLRGLSAPGIAGALAATGVFTVAGAWLGGMLTARLGSKRVIVTATAGSALFTLALIPPAPYPLTVGIVCLVALCNRLYMPASATMIGSVSPPERRLQMYSVFQLGYNAGIAIGSALAGYLLTRSLTVLLLADAATTACFALAALRLPARPSSPSSQGRQPDDGQAPDKVHNDPRYLVFCVGAAFFALAYSQFSGPVPLAFRGHHYSLVLLGYLFSGNAIAVIVTQLPLSYLTRRFPVRLPLAIGAALTGGAYLLLLAGFTVPLLVASITLWTAGEIVYAPAAPTVAAQMSKSRTHGSYQGALDVARSFGQAFGPSLGVLAYSAGSSLPWLGSAVLGVAAACLFLAAVRPGRVRPRAREGAGQDAAAAQRTGEALPQAETT
jgi:predicted MFS family arabinose efflux permease